MLYNGALCLQCVAAVILMIMHFGITTNSQYIFQSIFLFMLGDIAIELFATCILASQCILATDYSCPLHQGTSGSSDAALLIV